MQLNKTDMFHRPLQKKTRDNDTTHEAICCNSNKDSLVIRPIIIVQVNITNALKAQLPIYSQENEQINREIFQFIKNNRIKQAALPIIREMVIAQLRKVREFKLDRKQTVIGKFSIQTFPSQTSSLNQTNQKTKAVNILLNFKNGQSGINKKAQDIIISPLFPENSHKIKSPKESGEVRNNNKKNIFLSREGKLSKDKFSLQKLLNDSKNSIRNKNSQLQFSSDYNKENEAFYKRNTEDHRNQQHSQKQYIKMNVKHEVKLIQRKSSSPKNLFNHKRNDSNFSKGSTKSKVSIGNKSAKPGLRIQIPLSKYNSRQSYPRQENQNFESGQQKNRKIRITSKDPRQNLPINRYSTEQQCGELYSQNLADSKKLFKKRRPQPFQFPQGAYSSQPLANQQRINYSFSEQNCNQTSGQYQDEQRHLLQIQNKLCQKGKDVKSEAQIIKQYYMKDLQADMHSQISQILIEKAVKKLRPRIIELYKSLTKNNPPNLNKIHIDYINFSDLNERQLSSLQELFERISENELSNLTLEGFESVIVKYQSQSLVMSLK